MIPRMLVPVLLTIAFSAVKADVAGVNSKITAAQSDFEAATAKARGVLLENLKKKAEAAQKAGNLKAVGKIEDEIRQLEKRQSLPTLVSTKGYERERRIASEKLQIAYAEGVREYTKAGQLPQAKALQSLLDKLKRENALEHFPQLGKELLRNPGAEEAWGGGGLPGWKSVYLPWGIRKADPAPVEGACYFSPTPSPIAEIWQDVSLAPFKRTGASVSFEVQFRCSVRSFLQLNPDTTQVILEFRDGTNKVLDLWDSGKIVSIHSWTELTDTRVIPSKARWIRVRLISTRSGGLDNDGYFDNLSLKVKLKDGQKGDGFW